MQWQCLLRSALKLTVASYMEYAENSTFRTSFSIAKERLLQLDSDSNIQQSSKTMISFETWLKQGRSVIAMLTN